MDINRALQKATIEESLFLWMTVHGNLCLALRHPTNDGPSRGYTVAFVRKLGRLLVERGLLTQAELDLAEEVEREEMSPRRG